MEKVDVVDPYAELGVSSKKEGVHKATEGLSKGLYPGAFCKIIPMPGNLPQDVIDKYAQIIHSDGVGTKSNVAYVARKEGFDKSIYRTLPQDALVMNTDDMACVGVIDNIAISNHIARNANRVSDEDIAEIIRGYEDFYNLMQSIGINVYGAGGETADVGSYTTTLGIDVTATAAIEKVKVIDCANIEPGSYIVGLASYGQSSYEQKENSGIRSNGLTLAINALLHPDYREYTEAMDGTIDPSKLFAGKYHLTDNLNGTGLTIAEAILSPTRTYLPVIRKALEDGIEISGIIHCSGGGLTKSINFGNNIRYVKMGLHHLEVPAIFREIQDIRNIDDEHMYQTFNMGVGMEVILKDQKDAYRMRNIARGFNIDSDIIGVTEKTQGNNEVEIIANGKTLTYKK